MRDSKEISFSFHGNILVANNEPSEFMAQVQFPKWDPVGLSVDLRWLGDEDERRRGNSSIKHLDRNHLWLNSLDSSQYPVELLGISSVETTSIGSLVKSTSLRVGAVQIGITEEKCTEPLVYDVSISLQPSGILCLPSIHNQYFTGDIHVEPLGDGKVVLSLGGVNFEARETFEHYTTQENGNRVLHQIQKATLSGKVVVKPESSLFDIHESLKKELDDVCLALSLCYRQPVDYYEIVYHSPTVNTIGQVSHYRRRWVSAKVKTSGDELINTRALVGGGLQNLTSSLRNCIRIEDVQHAIQFISASYTATTEVAYFMAFSAMEAVLSCCLDSSENFVTGSSQWKKIHHDLRQAIDTMDQVDGGVRTGLCDKLPELRRSTLNRRINIACVKYRPKTDDLWPNTSFDEGMKHATKIRNGLFHAADSNVDESISVDLLRVRTFAERLLLKLLDWPDDAIWDWYDQDLKWANQGNR